ncbi:MAG TPA: hypothetical protein DE191_10695 [Enterobacter sp.]|nr:hypothetical protein [Enterobacter sp.]
MRILLFNGVNGHLLQTPGGKAGILAEWMRKANDCQQKTLINSPVQDGFFCPDAAKFITLLLPIALITRKRYRKTRMLMEHVP